MVVSLGFGDFPGHGHPSALEGVDTHDGGKQRRAHHLSPAGPPTFNECCEQSVRPVHPGEQVGDGHADALRIVRPVAGDGHQACLTLDNLVVAGPPAFRSVVAKTGDGQDDQPRVQLLHGRGGEAQAVHNAGAEILNHDVGPGQQFLQHHPIALGFQVQRDGFLVPVAGQEVRCLRVIFGSYKRRTPATGVVPGSRCLHFDDTGAQVSEHHPGVRTGECPAQVHDEESLKRSGGQLSRGLLSRGLLPLPARQGVGDGRPGGEFRRRQLSCPSIREPSCRSRACLTRARP